MIHDPSRDGIDDADDIESDAGDTKHETCNRVIYSYFSFGRCRSDSVLVLRGVEREEKVPNVHAL